MRWDAPDDDSTVTLRWDAPDDDSTVTLRWDAPDDDSTVTLRWDAPDDDSVAGYQILRRRPTMGGAKLLVYVADTGGPATTFTDTEVTASIRHVYRVKAINAAGLGKWSNYVRVEP